MKKLTAYIATILISSPLFAAKISDSQLELGRESAADNKEILFNIGEGTGNPKIRANYSTKKLEFTNDGTNFSEFGTGEGAMGYNIIENPGFESDLTNWTNTGSGSLSVDTDAADVYQGDKSALWDAAAASDVLASQAVTIPGGLRGNLCSVEVQYKGGDDNLKLQAYDGTNVLAEVALEASANFSKAMVTFTCPNSGTIQGRIIASADAAAVNVDNWVVGKSADILTALDRKVYSKDCTNSISLSNATWTYLDCSLYLPPGKYQGFLSGFADVDWSAVPTRVTAGLGAFPSSTSTSGTLVGGFLSPMTSTQNNGSQDTIDYMSEFNWAGGDVYLQGRIDTVGGTVTSRRFPRVSFTAIALDEEVGNVQRVETSAWHVNASLVGGDGTWDITSVNATSNLPSRADGELIENLGSIPAQIMCNGAAPTGTTCSGVDELPGIAFDAPRAGPAWICTRGILDMIEDTGTSDLAQRLNLYRVPTDGSVSAGLLGTSWTSLQDIQLQEWRVELEAGLFTAGQDYQVPYYLCGITNLVAGKNGFVVAERTRLFTGAPTDINMSAVRWNVFPIEQQLPQALITQTTDASSINTGTLDEDRLPSTINNVRMFAASGSTGVNSNASATNFARITMPTNLGYGVSGGVAHVSLASADQSYGATVIFNRQQNSNLINSQVVASAGSNIFLGSITVTQSGNELRFNYVPSSGNSGVVRATIIVHSVVPDISVSF